MDEVGPDYSKSGCYEWLLPFADLQPVFEKLELERGLESSVVVVGCGTSDLSKDLHLALGFHQVLSIDNDEAVIRHMKARHRDLKGLTFVLEDLTVYSEVVVDGTADLVVDKSTLDCLLCSDAAAGLICCVYRMLRTGGFYVVISFHDTDFLVSLLSMAFDLVGLVDLQRRVGPPVRAVTLRKKVIQGAEEASPCTAVQQLREQLQAFEAGRLEAAPLLTLERKQALEAAWPRDETDARIPLSVDEAYSLLFKDAEKREYAKADFQSDLSDFRTTSRADAPVGLEDTVVSAMLTASSALTVQLPLSAVAATLQLVEKLETLLRKESQTAEKGARGSGVNIPVGTKPVQTLLQTLVREWAAEGLQESPVSHGLKAIAFSSNGSCPDSEVSCRGHSVEACESRLLQWFGMELLRQNGQAEVLRPQPFALNTCNRLKFSDNHKVTAMPDVTIEEGRLPRQHFGEFITLYDRSDAKESFDCLLTSYALDLSPNVFRFVRTAAHVVRPGGVHRAQTLDPGEASWRCAGQCFNRPLRKRKARTAERKKNCLDCIAKLLEAVVGPGDLLSSDVRAEFAAEAYAAWGSCKACIAAKQAKLPQKGNDFAKYNENEIEHDFTTSGPFRAFAHAIVNRQQKLDEGFFQALVERLKQFVGDPKLGDDDFQAMAIELNTIAALCAGVRAFCAATGYEAPPLPAKPNPCKPGRFLRVSDYSTGPLQTNRTIAWVPTLPAAQLRADVPQRFGIDASMWAFAGANPHGPTSKASAAPLTCWEFLKFMDVMYVPVQDAPRFLKVPGKDRTLNRGQLEVAAADYTSGKACNF
ncbi:EEF1AKNMT [Symbiodinium necroappetens]|uniref:EEF1AKNMT protein n=1 Tax=Symbiodinium necroappetens TaxID=1628268 RepID=A0A812ZXF8_9DINO|nr:EEF1AKNMT [Symbiodinium necroappetens]